MPEILIARARSCLCRSFLTKSNHRFFPSNLPLSFTHKSPIRIPRLSFLGQQRTMATLGAYQKKHKVAIVGSGNWYVISSLPKDDQAWKQDCRKARCF